MSILYPTSPEDLAAREEILAEVARARLDNPIFTSDPVKRDLARQIARDRPRTPETDPATAAWLEEHRAKLKAAAAINARNAARLAEWQEAEDARLEAEADAERERRATLKRTDPIAFAAEEQFLVEQAVAVLRAKSTETMDGKRRLAASVAI